MTCPSRIAAGAPAHADPVDVAVGKRLRELRQLRGMTQQQIAEAVGVKFQQVQKYETGANRVSASRLWAFAQALGVGVETFFEACGPAPEEPVLSREELSLIAAYRGAVDVCQVAILNTARSLAGIVR